MKPAKSFDQDWSLSQLLSGIDTLKLHSSMVEMLGKDVRLIDSDGAVIFGKEADRKWQQRIPLIVELEPIGYLESDTDKDRTVAATYLLQQLLRSAMRYQMASSLHTEAVQADYELLKSKHAQLLESEASYKELSKSLEKQVQEQVSTIEETQRRLYQSEKLASVGQLAAGVAHEINNPVGFVRSNLGTAQNYLGRIDGYLADSGAGKPVTHSMREEINYLLNDFRVLLSESVDGADRIAHIVSALKDFSGVDKPQEEDADINDIIVSVCDVSKHQLGSNISTRLTLDELPRTRCQTARIGQLLFNLLINAAQAMKANGGEVSIQSRQKNDAIVISVQDEGSGIESSIQSRVFDPFFSTHDVGGGTGLGLTVSRDIVLAHDGSIELHSTKGEGTTVTVTLPIRNH